MARITRVAKAQQRYETVPVLNEDGTPKQTPVMKNGVQRTTKRGTPVFLTVTKADRTKPLPMPDCDARGCGKPIEVGKPYKHISPKSGPYGGRTRYRHADCPDWQIWEYSSSLSARVAEVEHDAMLSLEEVEDEDGVQEVLNTAAEAIREIATEKEEGADNIENGFGHETSQSEELRSTAEQLNEWADEIENITIPDLPDADDAECETCCGTGTVSSGTDEEKCEDCEGSGHPSEPTDEQMNDWRSEVSDEVSGVLGNCPV